MDYPKITVVTPSFNQGQFIEETILSVINQNYPNLEYIIIDGGSTDETLSIIKKYEKVINYWVSEKDDGQTHAIMKGFDKATGEILCWLNSDDLFEKDALHKIASFFNKNPNAEVVYGNSSWITKNGDFIKYKKEVNFNKFIWIFDYNYIPQPSVFWRKSLYLKTGGLDKSYHCAMDAYLWMKFMTVTKIYHIEDYLSKMRYYKEQKNIKFRDISNCEDRQIREEYLGRNITAFEYSIKHILAKGLRISLRFVKRCYGV